MGAHDSITCSSVMDLECFGLSVSGFSSFGSSELNY